MTTSNTWHDQIDAKQKLIEPAIQRAIDRVRAAVATRLPRVTDSLFYGAVGINPKHLAIWFIFRTTAERSEAQAIGLAQELDALTREALRIEKYPEGAIDLIHASVASSEEITKAGGWDFFR